MKRMVNVRGRRLRAACACAISVVAVSGMPQPAEAGMATNYWQSDSGNFNDPSRWRAPWAPGTNAVVYFDREGTYEVRFTESVTNDGLQIGSQPTTGGRAIAFNLGGNTYALAHADYRACILGPGATTLRISNGKMASNYLWLRGDQVTLIASGTNTGWTVADWGAVGHMNNARPLLRIENGARMAMKNCLFIPREGGNGFVEVAGNGAELTASRVFVGYAAGSRGELTVADGARMICASDLEIAYGIGSYGVLTINGGSITRPNPGGRNMVLGGNSVLRVSLHTGQTNALVTSATDIILDGGVFELSLARGFTCGLGETFTILAPAAGKRFLGEGMFDSLAEGDRISAGGLAFKVSYAGGDHQNCFTLTRVAARAER